MNWRQNLSRSKEVLGAYFRQGLHELGSIFYGPGTAAQHAEYGLIGTRTPGEVAEGLRGTQEATPSRNDPAPSALESHIQAARERGAVEPDRSDRGRELSEPERE